MKALSLIAEPLNIELTSKAILRIGAEMSSSSDVHKYALLLSCTYCPDDSYTPAGSAI
jgi:hypothetical protein